MPIHDWKRAHPCIFHDFHQGWTVAICKALNTGGLPRGYCAMIAPVIDANIEHITTPINQSMEESIYAKKANRILIKHGLDEVVGVIAIVSPGHKNSQHAIRAFVLKASALLKEGIHLLIVDLFPPSDRDPQGIHKAIWDEIGYGPFELPSEKPLTVVSYSAGPQKVAYIEPVAVGDVLPDMPIFLAPDWYVPAPLEATYEANWAVCPDPIRELLVPPANG